MRFAGTETNRERGAAATGVALLHAALLYALLLAPGPQALTHPPETLKLIDVADALPPPQADAAKERAPRDEGAAAPPNLEARPTPVVAPAPKVKLPVPPPIVTAPEASPLTGRDASAGASPLAGPGAGAGGLGSGSGSGDSGVGVGGGGGARAQRISGRLLNEDYPRSALRAGIEGSVVVRYVIGVDGLVSRCRVTRSSGHPELDSTTCRLIERRFRYRPARDSSGRPVAETATKTFDWLLPFRRAAH